MNPNRIRVLVVDDHPVLRVLAWRALKTGAHSRMLRGNVRKDLADKIRSVYHGVHRIEINEGTAKTHVKNILAKLGTNDRTHAVTEALRRGIIQL